MDHMQLEGSEAQQEQHMQDLPVHQLAPTLVEGQVPVSTAPAGHGAIPSVDLHQCLELAVHDDMAWVHGHVQVEPPEIQDLPVQAHRLPSLGVGPVQNLGRE
jgi:hypothetical protein